MATVIEELAIALGIDTKQAEKGLLGIGATLNKTEEKGVKAGKAISESFKELNKAAKEFGIGIARNLGERALGFVIDSVKDLVTQTKELGIVAQATGETVGNLSKVTGAGQLIGVAPDQALDAIKSLTEKTGEFARLGTGPFKDALATMGQSFEQYRNKTPIEQTRLFAEGLKSVQDPSQRLSIAMQVLGGNGAKLLPLLQDGAAGFDRLAGKAQEAGLALDEQTSPAIKQVSDDLIALQASAEGAAKAGAAHAAVWYKDNREALGVGATAVGGLSKAIADSLPGVRQTINLYNGTRTALDATADAAGGLSAKLTELLETGEIAAQATKRGFGGGQGDGGAAFLGVINAIGQRVGQGFQNAKALEDYQALSEVLPTLGRSIATDAQTFGRDVSQFLGARAGQVQNIRTRAAARGARRGGGGRTVDAVLQAGLSDPEYQRLAAELADRDRTAKPAAIAAAQQALARSLGSGANSEVARRAGFSTLGGFTGKDYAAPNTALSALLGSAAPDVGLAELTQNRTPQVLISTINNNFEISQNFDFGAVSNGQDVPTVVVQAFKDLFQNEIQKTSKMAKVQFAR